MGRESTRISMKPRASTRISMKPRVNDDYVLVNSFFQEHNENELRRSGILLGRQMSLRDREGFTHAVEATSSRTLAKSSIRSSSNTSTSMFPRTPQKKSEREEGIATATITEAAETTKPMSTTATSDEESASLEWSSAAAALAATPGFMARERFLVRNRSRASERHGFHRLQSLQPGQSQVELLAYRIEERITERLCFSFAARSEYLNTFHTIATAFGYNDNKAIRVEDLLRVQKEYEAKIEATKGWAKIFEKILNSVGVRTVNQDINALLNRAVEELDPSDLVHLDAEFRFRDFLHYNTIGYTKVHFSRNKRLYGILCIVLFYLLTPIVFCGFYKDKNVCPTDPSGNNRWYYGWVTSLYFASATMSTVGYGDLTIHNDDNGWRYLLGIAYILSSTLLATVWFTAAISGAFSPLEKYHEKLVRLMKKMLKPLNPLTVSEDQFLYAVIRRKWWITLIEITVHFTVLNFIGIIVAKSLGSVYDKDGNKWSWMKSIYWSVQTTTTVGYGDIDIPYEMYWFCIVYLILGTKFVGNTIGRLGRMNKDIDRLHRLCAWNSRQVDTYMIKDIKPYGREGPVETVDQYEYVLASLLDLGKISSEDIVPIMNKFRTLAQLHDHGDPGLIEYSSYYIQRDDLENTKQNYTGGSATPATTTTPPTTSNGDYDDNEDHSAHSDSNSSNSCTNDVIGEEQDDDND